METTRGKQREQWRLSAAAGTGAPRERPSLTNVTALQNGERSTASLEAGVPPPGRVIDRAGVGGHERKTHRERERQTEKDRQRKIKKDREGTQWLVFTRAIRSVSG